MSFGLVGLVALLVIALAIFASPLLAMAIAIVAAVFLLAGMSAMRRRSAAADRAKGAPDSDPTAARPRGEGGGRDSGAPVSGEG
jgi:hypothetical protein